MEKIEISPLDEVLTDKQARLDLLNAFGEKRPGSDGSTSTEIRTADGRKTAILNIISSTQIKQRI